MIIFTYCSNVIAGTGIMELLECLHEMDHQVSLQWLWQVWKQVMTLDTMEEKLFKSNCYSLNGSCLVYLYVCVVIKCWTLGIKSLYLLYQHWVNLKEKTKNPNRKYPKTETRASQREAANAHTHSHHHYPMTSQNLNFQCHSLIYLITLSLFFYIIISTILLYSVWAQFVPVQGLVQLHACHLSL